MQQNSISVFIKCFLKNFHGNQIMIDRFACFFINCSEFKLIIGNLVVLCFEWDTNIEEFRLYFSHNLLYFARHLPIVMIRKLLIFCSNLSNESSACINQIWPEQESLFGNYKIFLLKAEVDKDLFGFNIKSMQHFFCWFLHDCFAFSKDSLVI